MPIGLRSQPLVIKIEWMALNVSLDAVGEFFVNTINIVFVKTSGD